MTAPIRHKGNVRLGGVYKGTGRVAHSTGNPSPGFVPMARILDPIAFTVGVLSIRGNVIEIAEMSRAGKIWVWKLCYINAFDDTGRRYATPDEAEGAGI